MTGGEGKQGGKPLLRILLKGEGDLSDALLSRQAGGRKVERGIEEIVKEKYGGRFHLEISQRPGATAARLRDELEQMAPGDERSNNPPDLVVLSLYPEIVGNRSGPQSGHVDASRYVADMEAVVEAIKRAWGAHVIVFNASTVDPSHVVRNYHGLESDPPSFRIHKLDLALLELSVRQGISIIDVDRVLAELGADGHVRSPLDYSPAACAAICEEFLRVLEDYGFFEERPLLMQVGRQK